MNTKKNLSALVVVGALLSVTLVPMSTAEGSGGVLATFPHGSPEDARWTMLKLEVTQPGVRPQIVAPLAGSICPFAWSFQFLTGSPEDARVYNGVTINQATGHGGAEAYAIGPAGFVADASLMSHDHGGQSCLDMTWTINFGALPVGTVYMLEYLAGGDFPTEATLSVNGPGVTIVDRSSGMGVTYLEPRDYQGAAHVGAYSPPACIEPGLDGSCLTWWSGGTAGGADASVDRTATVQFAHHPFFRVSSASGSDTNLDVSNVTVTDPAGATMWNGQGADATAAGLNVNGRGYGIAWTKNVLPGSYEYRLHGASVGVTSTTQWRVYGADVEFPEEQAAP